MLKIHFWDQREPKDSGDLKVSQGSQVLQDVEITIVSLVTQGNLVTQDLKDLLETKGLEELKVVQGIVTVGLVGGGKGHLVHLVIQDLQGYLELKDLKETQG